MKYKHSKEILEKAAKASLSIAEMCRKLDIRPVGGNYKTLRYKIKINEIDITHFTGQGWNVGERYKSFNPKKDLKIILVKDSNFMSTHKLKNRLFEEGLKQKICENCNNKTWLDGNIPLELNHKNGNNMDHRIENLEILCPNCHALTDNYRGKSKIISKREEIRKNNHHDKAV